MHIYIYIYIYIHVCIHTHLDVAPADLGCGQMGVNTHGVTANHD